MATPLNLKFKIDYFLIYASNIFTWLCRFSQITHRSHFFLLFILNFTFSIFHFLAFSGSGIFSGSQSRVEFIAALPQLVQR